MAANRLWTPLTILLVAAIAIGSIIAWSRASARQAIEIAIADSHFGEEPAGEIYIGGTVANPGFYPVKTDDTIVTLIQAAGGTSGAQSNGVKLYITSGEEESPKS